MVVTHNSERWLARTLDGAAGLDGVATEIVVVDSGSRDGSLAVARGHPGVSRVIALDANIGFAAGQNIGIRASTGELVLSLNPDVFLDHRYVGHLAPRLTGRYGFGTGRLLRADPETGEAIAVIDSTGLFFTRERRHVDRGAGEAADNRYCEAGDVFGACGAALLARRDALDDVSPPGRGPFDEAFWSYREDADLAWRAQVLGWRCWYEPSATGAHVRALKPDQHRSTIDPLINMHSVKNRYLLLVKNETWRGLRPDLWPFLRREALVAAGVVLRERSSGRAYPLLAGALPRALRERRWIASRRHLDADTLRRRQMLPA